MATKDRYIGVTGKRHASISEAQASFYYASLGFVPCEDYLPGDFYDKEGTPMPSKGDYYHPVAELYLEHKAADLNGVGTKATSKSQLESKAARRGGKLIMPDLLKFGWNHSRESKSIIQAKLTPQNYIVVFEKKVPIKAAMSYTDAGIVFCTMKSLPAYLAKVRLAKRGLNLPFRLHYTGPEPEVDCLLLS
jgi:hypothetical protein